MIQCRKEEDGAVLRLVLDAPKGNILDAAMIDGVTTALDREVDARVKLVVFEGAGKHFSFGASVEEHKREAAPKMLEKFHALFRHLARLAVPTCALVRGQCLGGGLELASYCTFIVATTDARLGQPEIKLAVFAPMASVLLPWRLGAGRALDLCVSGRSITAAEAKDMGLVSAVTDDPEAWIRALYAESLKPTSASSLRFAERAARADLNQRLERDLPAIEQLYLEDLMATHDANEGIAAFLERRPASFKDA
ncbi:MAG: enoyl-CoA hydratase-related protein [Polyangiaceae bacterium]